MSDSKWSEETEQAIFNELTAQFPHASTNEWVWAAQAIAHALADAGLLVTPSTSGSDLYVVIKTVPRREPEILDDVVSGLIEVWEWVNDMTNDPDRDPLATYVGYRLGPIPPRPAEVQP